MDITQSFDGDGQILKRYEVDTIYQEGEPPYTETSTLYQLRSSVLGGKVLTEIAAQGQKTRTFVYANGAVLAWQLITYFNGNVSSQIPVWEHRDVSNASFRTSQISYSGDLDWAELDPFNSNMGFENPYHFPPDPPLPHKPNIFYPGFGTGASSYCLADGIERSCSEVFRLLSLGLAEQCQNNNCGPRVFEFTPTGQEFLVPLSNDKETGAPGYYPEQWGYSWEDFLLPKNMINQAKKQAKQQKTEVSQQERGAYRGRIAEMLKGRCAEFLNRLLNEAKARTGKPYEGILDSFDRTKFYWSDTGAIYGGYAYLENGAPVADVSNRINTERMGGSLANQRDRHAYLISSTTQDFLGETLHHVASGVAYTDGVMANALNAILVRQGRDTHKDFSDLTTKDVDNASRYWHPKVWSACPAPRR